MTIFFCRTSSDSTDRCNRLDHFHRLQVFSTFFIFLSRFELHHYHFFIHFLLYHQLHIDCRFLLIFHFLLVFYPILIFNRLQVFILSSFFVCFHPILIFNRPQVFFSFFVFYPVLIFNWLQVFIHSSTFHPFIPF